MQQLELENSDKILVAYFSYSGNTNKIARQIQNFVGGVVFEIQVANRYPAAYNDVLKRAKEEIRSGARPELENKPTGLENYDVVFIGYPNWWNTFPAPVLSFLSDYDFTGKKIIPFCTHGGGGSGRSFTDIANQCRGAEVIEGFSINGYAVNENNIEIVKWINNIKNRNK